MGALVNGLSVQLQRSDAAKIQAESNLPSESALVSQLERLVALHRDGLLSDEELAKTKARLLDP